MNSSNQVPTPTTEQQQPLTFTLPDSIDLDAIAQACEPDALTIEEFITRAISQALTKEKPAEQSEDVEFRLPDFLPFTAIRQECEKLKITVEQFLTIAIMGSLNRPDSSHKSLRESIADDGREMVESFEMSDFALALDADGVTFVYIERYDGNVAAEQIELPQAVRLLAVASLMANGGSEGEAKVSFHNLVADRLTAMAEGGAR